MSTANTLLENQRFIELDSLLNRFNIFEATDMGRRETKHTKFLAYLLNPNESHGLGDSFLLAFLGKLSTVSQKQYEILALHTEYAQVASEYTIIEKDENKNLKRQIDIILKIPYINSSVDSKKFLVIAIENKINATQNVDQLKRYSDAITAKFSDNGDFAIEKFLLTENKEKSADETWIEILYSDTIIPVILQILESKNGKISDYMRFSLLDYFHLMNKDEESDLKIEDITREVVQKVGTDVIRSIRENEPSKFLNEPSKSFIWNNLWLKYPKACKQLSKFDTDNRSYFLNEWLNYDPVEISPEVACDKLIFNREKSQRKYFRFSILTQKNILKLQEISSKKWINSGRCIAFEVTLDPVISIDDNNKKLKIGVKLVFFPGFSNFDKKLRLTNKILEGFKQDGVSSISPFYTTLRSVRDFPPGKMEEIDEAHICTWFKEHIYDKENNQVNAKLVECSKIVNSSISEFFKLTENNL